MLKGSENYNFWFNLVSFYYVFFRAMGAKAVILLDLTAKYL